jgi:glycosyltransferase involved in cell wall biosynthesis
MASPTVSVIIPNYNHAPYLRERIDSVLGQTFQDFELILLDDCSTDQSRDVLLSYKGNPHVSHILLNEQNTGNTFVQWERGIELAKGELIWVAESDDVAEPLLLETLVDELRQHPEAAVAYCHSQMIDSEGHPLSYSWHPHGSSGKTVVYDGKWYLRHKMLVHNHIYNASMTVFRKELFSQIPKDYQQYRYCGDWLFWNHVCMHGQVIEVCRVLNRYRQHERKVTMDSQHDGRKWRDIGGILRELSDMLRLTPLQCRCLRGRWTKRAKKEAGNTLPALRHDFPDLYAGTKTDILLYETGKLLGFLKQP